MTQAECLRQHVWYGIWCALYCGGPHFALSLPPGTRGTCCHTVTVTVAPVCPIPLSGLERQSG